MIILAKIRSLAFITIRIKNTSKLAGLMKWQAIIVLALISSCARQQEQNPIPDTFNSLNDWQAFASNQVRNWVPPGTPTADAEHIMEQHHFTTFTNGPTFLGYYYYSSTSWKNLVEERIII